MLRWKPHSIKQRDAVFSKHKITALLSGIQFGKTASASIWMRKQIHETFTAESNYLVCAPTYKILQQSTLPTFLSDMQGLGVHNKGDSEFKIYGGGTIFIRSLSDPNSIVGITNVRGLWIDEAGLISLYAWENAQARAAFRDAPIMLTSSPYTLNWLYKEIIRPYKLGKRHDEVKLIQARSDENPYFPKSEYERRKLSMDPRRFRAMFGGEWERPEGLVFDCFDEMANTCKPFPLPLDSKYYAAVDWGYRDPFCILIRAVTPYGDHFDVSEFYKSGLKPSEMIQMMEAKQKVYGLQYFYCDPSRPEMIAEARSKGVRAMPANNSIQLGIDKYYELIKSRRYKIFNNMCPNLIDELDSYHYAQDIDLMPDQARSKKYELPVDQHNHAIDCARYLTMALDHGTERPKVHSPDEMAHDDKKRRFRAPVQVPHRTYDPLKF